MAAFIAQLIETSVTARKLWESGVALERTPLDTPLALRMLLRNAAAQQPAVCLIDDLDKAEGSLWSDHLLMFAREIAADLPILLFVGLDGPASLALRPTPEPDLISVARALTSRGLAEWWPLRPLTEQQVAAWIGPADPAVVTRLHAVTGGNPRWITLLWDDWCQRRVVQATGPADEWRIAPGNDPSALAGC
jgi:hypothetical protein